MSTAGTMGAMASASGSNPQLAVFLSYAREDAAGTRRFAGALRAAGVEVWFDESELRGGEAWDRAIRKQIRDCALFVPVISANTQARAEGYFRLEWHLAEQRSLLIAKSRPFIVPVCIDATPERDALVPDAFLAVQWTRLPGGESTPEFVERMRGLLGLTVVAKRVPAKAADPAGASAAPPHIADYELIRLVGRGSYGDVWLARGVTGLWRAIKIVWRDRFADAEPFEREFRGLKEFAAISLDESIQLALLHVGRNDEAGFFYYVMELADDAERGREIDPARYVPLTLTEMRARRGRLPAAECVGIGVELARVLAGLHRRGLIHRDIKPSNVILVGGVPKLADIGLVTPASDARTFVGTEGFVPPEGPGSPAADVFALGKLLYELSTGLDRQEFPQLPAELNRLPDHRALLKLNEVVLRAGEPMPDRRYADASAMLADLLVLQTGSSLRRRRTITWIRRVGVAAAIMALVAAGVWWKQRSSAFVSPAASDKSIAVLPFENRSDDKANAFFADGIHEDVLTNLAHIADLRVVSRTSVMGYRGSAKNSRQIGQELGVAWLLEGSVQRAGNKVHVTGQLINARTDEHVWAQNYDRDLTDVFEIQSALAQEIVTALKVTLSPQEKIQLSHRPTANPEAYDLYLKASTIPYFGGQTTLALIEGLLRKAVELDPGFAEAWAALGDCRAKLVFEEYDTSAENREAAKTAIDWAVRLASGNPTVIWHVSNYYYHADRDYVRAAAQFMRLAQLQPNDARIFRSLGEVQRQQGRWADALANFKHAFELDPGNSEVEDLLFDTLIVGRRFDEAETLARRWLKLRPGSNTRRFQVALAAFYARGSVVEIDEYVRRELDPSTTTSGFEYLKLLTRLRGDFATGLRFYQMHPFLEDFGQRWAQEILAAELMASAGDMVGARAKAQATLPTMLAELPRQPGNSWLHSTLALAYALLGDKEQALHHAQRATEIRPESRDVIYGTGNAVGYASVLAWVGEKDRAIAEVARLLRTPYGVNVRAARNGAASHWGGSFKPLLDDPRFQALLADPANDAPLF